MMRTVPAVATVETLAPVMVAIAATVIGPVAALGGTITAIDAGVVEIDFLTADQYHAQDILVMIEELLASGEVSLSMLDGIAASIGPGAFTGVRISVAVAQCLAFGAGLAVVPVTTL